MNERRVLITGASSGIGAALAKNYGDRGAGLLLFARRRERLEAIRDRYPQGQVQIASGDIRDFESIKEACSDYESKFGPLDTVVANAGYGVVGRIEKLSLKSFHDQFSVNFDGVLNTIWATFDQLKKTRGRLALMGSINGYVSEAKKSPYCASKFAVRGLADSLYYELGSQGISVTHIAPGLVASEIRKINKDGVYDPNQKDVAPKNLTMPSDVAARQMVRAIESRKREVVVTRHGKVLVFLQRHIPWMLSPLLRRGPVSRKID